MTYKQIVEATAQLEELRRSGDLHEDSLHMLDEWWREWLQELKRRERCKIVDINEYRYWRQLA